MKATDLFVVQRPSGTDSGTYKIAASDIPANAVVSSTAPSNPIDGALWFDTSSSTLKTWNGTTFVESSASGGVTSIIAGSGISVNQATGAVTVTSSGGAVDDLFYENKLIVSTSISLTASRGFHAVGPITVNTGVSLTIPANTRLVIS